MIVRRGGDVHGSSSFDQIVAEQDASVGSQSPIMAIFFVVAGVFEKLVPRRDSA
jgi:hypothetical protein